MAASRPTVLVNFAASIDGKIAPVPERRGGAFQMSRGREDWQRMREIRATADAILIGAGNLRADNPDLALLPDERARRRAAGEGEPLRIVLTRRGEGVTPDRRIFDQKLGGAALVLHADSLPAEARAALAPVARLAAFGATDVDLPRALAWLAEDLGVKTLLCEGGGILCAQLFSARAVDRLFVTFVPRILGGAEAPTLAEGAGFDPDQIPGATIGALDRVGDELFLRYDFSWT